VTKIATKNPDPEQIADFIRASAHRAARRIIDPRSGDVWVWPAEQATHAEGAERLGVPYDKKPGEGDILTGDLTFLKTCFLVKVCYPHPS
jgi:hypothetical protein